MLQLIHQKENSVSFRKGVVLCAALCFFSFVDKGISPRLQQKMEAAVQSTFVLEDFQLDHIAVSKKLDERTAVALGGDNLFQINSNGNRVGYVYLGQAPSMKNVFDYVVLFNPDMSIKKSKVLIYREDYGRQIGSQRWLKQFIGKTSGDPLDYGKNIDAISGATISAKSMTKAVQEVLSSMAILKAASIL